MIHRIHPACIREPVTMHVIGAGGNGSQMVNGLARLHVSLMALGHPGLEITVFDPDVVTHANLGRQLFSQADLGQNKASVIVNRLNAFYGLNWKAMPVFYGGPEHDRSAVAEFIIGCVDTRQARRVIHWTFQNWIHESYWLDLGNDSKTGQIVLGETPRRSWTIKSSQLAKGNEWKANRPNGTPENPRLPTVVDLYRDILDDSIKEDNTPSCSLAGALEKQDLFVNQMVSTFALNMLWQLFRQGQLEYHGGFVNLQTGFVMPLPVDVSAWERMGYHLMQQPPWRKIKKVIIKPRIMVIGKFLLECGHTSEGHGKTKARCHECLKLGRKV